MTIVASVKVRDGLVLGTDSMTQIWGPAGYVASFANAVKLFRLSELPVGVMTHGLGNIENRSIEGIVLDFCRELPEDVTAVPEIAQRLYEHIRALYDAVFSEPTAQQALGMIVAGFSPEAPLGEEYEFLLPSDAAPRPIRPPEEVGSSWRGITAPFAALGRGISPGFHQALIAQGVAGPELDALSQEHGMQVALAGMPLQDAVDYATYMLDVTIGWARFQVGVDACARPLQMAVITADHQWKWLSKPKLAVPQLLRET